MRARGHLGLLAWLVGAWALGRGLPLHAQLSVFGVGPSDGGMGIPSGKILSNPWRVDAGAADGGKTLDLMGGFSLGGGGQGFLREKAPHIADWMESDASMFSASGGGFSFSLPSFGADLDAGPVDAGPVVWPTLALARRADDVLPLTTPRVPQELVWAALPLDAMRALARQWPQRAGRLAPLSAAALSPAERRALWEAIKVFPGWTEGASGFLLGDVGRPAGARLVALGGRKDAQGQAWFYGGFSTARDARQVQAARVVLAATANPGPYRIPQIARPAWNRRPRALVEERLAGRSAVGGVWVRHQGVPGWLVLLSTPGSCQLGWVAPERAPLLGALRRGPCGAELLAAVDVDGDGEDEFIQRVGDVLLLSRLDGTVLAREPPLP